MHAARWGIVSAGKISHDFVCCLKDLSPVEHQVVAVAGRDLANAKRFAELHGIRRVHPSYEALAQDDDVEVAYIGCLNVDHRATAMLMLQHGKHVLCEKPLTVNLKETRELLQMAAKKRLFLMEGMWSRFTPLHQELRKELQVGTLGEARYVHVTGGYDMRHLDRVVKKSMGGSSVLNIGIYSLSLILWVFGREYPRRIVAVGEHTSEGVDQACAVSLEFSDGRLANFAASTTLCVPRTAEVVCTKGVIRLGTPCECPTEMETPDGLRVVPLPETTIPCNYINSSGLRYEAQEVRRCLQAGLLESPDMSHVDSELLARLTEEIREQLRENIHE